MTDRALTEEEIRQANADYPRAWLSMLTLGLIPEPEREPEIEIA